MPSKNDKKISISEKVVTLRVQKAKKRDIGKNIIRIDTSTMDELDIQTGDIIGVRGKKDSAAVAWPSYAQDNGLGIVRFDSRLRKNTGTSIDDNVEIGKANVFPAQYLILAPSGVRFRANPKFESFVKRKLNNYPVTLDDIILISVGISKEIAFKVINMRPKGVCVINQETNVHISDDVSDEHVINRSVISYEDIGGLDEQIKKLKETIELPLLHPNLYNLLGVKTPKGILLKGPPGCGKDSLAKAVAYESGAHFMHLSGPELINKFHGESEKKLRKIFMEAEEKSPSIIYIDQIDSIAPNRNFKIGKIERRILAQLLSLMDGINVSNWVFVIASTNKPDFLDPALRRPGRFDYEIEVPPPDEAGRRRILEIHTNDMPIEDNISLNKIAESTKDFTGADISKLCREAAINALRRNYPELEKHYETVDQINTKEVIVEYSDFEAALKEITPYSSIKQLADQGIQKIENSDIQNRKLEHLKIPLEYDVQHIDNYLNDIKLIHHPLPEFELTDIDISIDFFGKKIAAPICIAAITGGHPISKKINEILAKAAEAENIIMSVGSQRAALDNPALLDSFSIVRKVAPNIPIVGNIGMGQVSDSNFKVETFKKCIDMINADVMAIHLNALHELVQDKGNISYSLFKKQFEEIRKEIKIPIIAKEVGAGFNRDATQILDNLGFDGFDVGGAGGTSFAAIESIRSKSDKPDLTRAPGEVFREWGTPTPISVLNVRSITKKPIIATGGLKTGIDIAKSIVLGADIGGFAFQFLQSAMKDYEEKTTSNTIKEIKTLKKELQSSLWLMNVKTIEELKSNESKRIILGKLYQWLHQ